MLRIRASAVYVFTSKAMSYLPDGFGGNVTVNDSRLEKQAVIQNRIPKRDMDQENVADPKGVFVSVANAVTGKMNWVFQDENYDYVQEIARSGYGDMLHDKDRNVKYFQAIRRAVSLMKSHGKQVRVLDIGTGTGLLSMMAVDAGADKVTACEAFPPMAECAGKVLVANKMRDKINLIPKRSTQVLLGEHMEERANVLVTELFDTELIGEGAISSYTDAHSRLMEQGCLAVPSAGLLYVQAVSCELLRRWNTLQPIHLPNGQTVTVPDCFTRCGGAPSLHDVQVDELEEHLTLVSQPVQVFRFDFSRRDALRKEEHVQHTVSALCSSQVDAFVMWWDLEMDPAREIILSCGPRWAREDPENVPWRDHWMQALYYPAVPLSVEEGNDFHIYSSHDEYSLWFDTSRPSRQRPVCECGLHITYSRTRIGQMNDSRRNHIFISSLQKHIGPSTVCLIISDGSFLPLIAAKLGAKQVFYMDTSPSSRRLMRKLIEENMLQDRVMVLDKDAEDITCSDLMNLKIDLVVAEPYFQAAQLPWEHLYFWYALSTMGPHLSPDAVVLPSNMSIKAIALEFRDLQKIRAPVGQCEGFDIAEFDGLIESSSESADSPVEPQPLWEYPARALSHPTTVFTLGFTQPIEAGCGSGVCTEMTLHCHREGHMNGVAFWTEFDFCDGLTVATGVEEDNWEEEKVRWDKWSRQGVQLLRQGVAVQKDSKVLIKTEFTPNIGNFSISVNTAVV